MVRERRVEDVKHINLDHKGLMNVVPAINQDLSHVTTAYEDAFVP